jgi:hypothetical protein
MIYTVAILLFAADNIEATIKYQYPNKEKN